MAALHIAGREREMDQTQQQKLQVLNEFTKSQFLKKLTQLLLSVSVFSYFFSHSPWLSFLFHSFNFYSFPFQLLTHTINKNCIFLLCNGILVFLAKTSGLIRSSSSSSSSGFDHADEYLFKKTGNGLPLPLLDKEAAPETAGLHPEIPAVNDGEDGDGKDFFKEEEAGNLIEEDDGTSVLEVQSPEKPSIETSLFIEEEENWLLSNEELNKKCDDFIRRMKEEIRIGSMTTDHSIVIEESSSFHESV